jgi:hypothetical protein
LSLPPLDIESAPLLNEETNRNPAPSGTASENGRTVQAPEDNCLAAFTTEVIISSAQDFFQRLLSEPLSSHAWVFRGHADSTWRLQPSLERHAARKKIGPMKAERFVIHEFKRVAHQYELGWRTAQKEGEARRGTFPRPPGSARRSSRTRRWRQKRPALDTMRLQGAISSRA